jgi:hypothetical protein
MRFNSAKQHFLDPVLLQNQPGYLASMDQPVVTVDFVEKRYDPSAARDTFQATFWVRQKGSQSLRCHDIILI